MHQRFWRETSPRELRQRCVMAVDRVQQLRNVRLGKHRPYPICFAELLTPIRGQLATTREVGHGQLSSKTEVIQQVNTH
jgi:hypothetical protein